MNKKMRLQWLVPAVCCCFAIACHFPRCTAPTNPGARVVRISDLKPTDSRLMPDYFGDKKILRGGVVVFKPGQTAHPEPRHVHETDEVFILIQGKGILPIEGVEYPVKTGDVAIVKAGEDHHLRSSVEDPLVAAWYLMAE